MTSPFETAGFTTFRLPQAVQGAETTQPAATNPVVQTAPSVTVPENTSSDSFTSNAAIDRDALKDELRQEIINEMKTQQELDAKQKADEEKKKNKLGPIKRLKRFIGNVKKGVVTAGEYTKGFFKGTLQGGIAGGVLGGAIYATGKVLKDPAVLVQTPVVGKLFRNLKIVSNPEILDKSILAKVLKSKTTAIAAGGVALAIGLISALWKASINANEKRDLIEHKYESTPTIRK